MPLRQLSPDTNINKGGETKIDIIAIPGLNPWGKSDADHAWDTWCAPSGPTGRLWLRDDLPKHVPGARILLYQYNSSPVYGRDRSTFIDKANELLEDVRIARGNADTTRPILFLGHSTGGLLIKLALINAHNNPRYTPIKDATSGLAFFATPHHGGDWKLLKIASKAGLQKSDDMMETTKQGSIFSDIMQEYWRHQLLLYDIISFWGAYDDIVSRESARLGLPGDRENIVKLDSDHTNVCKFGDDVRDQDNLKRVRGNIKDLYKKALRHSELNAIPSPVGLETQLDPALYPRLVALRGNRVPA
ncbi:NB-ARC domain-containing protein [Colletotrichum truncatum]|uniref:NB-ARC domain-containing protein n=1 Tax=Colletotrichum truncatum TaxID=5467 RepID=A0ACC3YMJ9_COLTU|nr:NB-ARC domain-containing protein [Colletotrichum truncatum]KAF6783367.1 NB-ARC domain-containing protein [Colletotrichum truncatum]